MGIACHLRFGRSPFEETTMAYILENDVKPFFVFSVKPAGLRSKGVAVGIWKFLSRRQELDFLSLRETLI